MGGDSVEVCRDNVEPIIHQAFRFMTSLCAQSLSQQVPGITAMIVFYVIAVFVINMN